MKISHSAGLNLIFFFRRFFGTPQPEANPQLKGMYEKTRHSSAWLALLYIE